MEKALSKYAEVASRKTIPDILNQKTPFVIKAAMRKTPVAARARIRADLGSASSPSILALKIISSRAKRKGQRLTYSQASGKAAAMIRARLASVRYISLGWLPALSNWTQVRKPLSKRSVAAQTGKGYRATSSRHYTRFINGAPGVKMGESALASAMSSEAKSTRDYAARKMRMLSRKYN